MLSHTVFKSSPPPFLSPAHPPLVGLGICQEVLVRLQRQIHHLLLPLLHLQLQDQLVVVYEGGAPLGPPADVGGAQGDVVF